MSRASRLLELMELLRRHQSPVAGAALADTLGVSLRTLYRDLETLKAQGADIQGEPGLGYVLRPGFTLPPLMLTADEIEALVLGSRWVSVRADERLAAAALHAIAKLRAVLPRDLRESVDAATMTVPGSVEKSEQTVDLASIRAAIRNQHKLRIAYRDRDGSGTERTIWPLLIGVFERVLVVPAWCELRQDYRAFRVDRMLRLDLTASPFPRARGVLLKEWREKQGIEPADRN